MPYAATDDDVANFIERISASKALGRSARRLQLLEHLLRAEVHGQGKELKAYSIGLDIFQKSSDFDPSTDSIVRVEMGRLRMALAAFEGTEFADTRVKVTIPTGTYRPVIEAREKDEPAEIDEQPLAKQSKKDLFVVLATAAAIVLGFLAYQFFTPAPARSKIVVEVAEFEGPSDIASLSRSAILAGLSKATNIEALAGEAAGSSGNARFVVTGSATLLDDGILVISELRQAGTNRVSWVKSVTADSLAALPKAIDEDISGDLRVELFGAFKRLLDERDISTLSPEELFVLATWVPGHATNAAEWEQERIQLAKLAIEKDPEYGSAHSVLADKIAYLANVHAPSNTDTALEEARHYAQRALELSPLDPDTVFNVAQALWHSGRISESERVMKRVLDLDPNHFLARYLASVIPYTCMPAPDAVVDGAIAFDATLSTGNPIRWLTLTWIGWLHAYRGEWEEALAAEQEAAVIFEIPYSFMRHAMILNKLGRLDEARQVIERQKTNWPDINARHFAEVTIPRLCQENPEGAAYIQHYVEFSDALSDSN